MIRRLAGDDSADTLMTTTRLKNFVTPLHRASSRDYLHRMTDDKVGCMVVAKKYGRDYWDGDRRFGYGGYRYDGRWRQVALELIAAYNLPADARILDVGCGKAHLLHELSCLLPGASITGFDASAYAITCAPETVRERLFVHRAELPFPFADNSFDLVFSLTTLHNLPLRHLSLALGEMKRLGGQQYICVESFRNEQELFNLQCWALSCETFLRPEDWIFFFGLAGYNGDFEFIFFE